MNDTQTTVDWEHVREHLSVDRRKRQFKDTALILGNGASVSISPRFDYQQLLDESGLPAKTVDAIRNNCEVNFEEALRVLAIANKLLDSDADARLTSVYELIRDGLIRAVQGVHPQQREVKRELLDAVRVLRWFPTVITISYDLLLYWAMMLDRGSKRGNWFKDGFTDGARFDAEWERLRKPHQLRHGSTIVFYAHGNLALVDDLRFGERKLSVSDESTLMLDFVLRQWEREHVYPLFVSEGLPEFKRHKIKSSPYLSLVYRRVLGDMPANVVVYGWSLREQDQHLIEQVLGGSVELLAISNYRDTLNTRQAGKAIEQAAAKAGRKVPKVVFYDAESAWTTSAS